MKSAAAFDQFCPVAVSLDILGDRWGLLLMRDMLWAGPQSRVGLLERNPSLDDETLGPVVKRLTTHGLIEQLDEPKARYALTEKGQGIGGVINALFNFGMPLLAEVIVNDWMLSYTIADCSRRKRLDLLEVEQRYLVQMAIDEADLCVELSPGLLRVVTDHEPHATVRLNGGTLAALIGAVETPEHLIAADAIEIEGDSAAAIALLDFLPATH